MLVKDLGSVSVRFLLLAMGAFSVVGFLEFFFCKGSYVDEEVIAHF